MAATSLEADGGEVEATYTLLVAPESVTCPRETLRARDLLSDELLCRTRVTAVSPGTELAAYHGHPPLRPTAQAYPRLLGYLNVSEVLACGDKVSTVAPGDRILSFTSHRSHFILNLKRIRARVPDDVDDRHAAVAYLYRLALSGLRRARVHANQRAVVLGLGPIGLAAVELAASWGASVAALSSSAASRKRALELGAKAARDKSSYNREAAIEDLGALPNAVVSTSNVWADFRTAVSILDFNGVVALLGFPGRNQGTPDFNPFDPQFFYDQQLSFVSAGMTSGDLYTDNESPEVLNNDLAKILEAFRSGTLTPEALLAEEFAWRDLTNAYRYLTLPDHRPGTVLLRWT